MSFPESDYGMLQMDHVVPRKHEEMSASFEGRLFVESATPWHFLDPEELVDVVDAHLEAVEELSKLAELLGVALPGVDAQTQTDLEEGDAPYEPWHCWSHSHQERQYELDEQIANAVSAAHAQREPHSDDSV